MLHDERAASIVTEIGAEAFAAAESRGRSLTPEEVFADAADAR